MRAYLVLPDSRSIEAVEIPPNPESIELLLGGEVAILEMLVINDQGDCLCFDKEPGMFGEYVDGFGFKHGDKGAFSRVPSKGLIIGSPLSGQVADVNISLEALKSLIFWLPSQEVED